MTDEIQPDRNNVDESAKKPYEPPRIVSREPLEALAAVCSPVPPAKSSPGVCPSGPISS